MTKIPWRLGLGLQHSLTGMVLVMNLSGRISVPNNISLFWGLSSFSALYRGRTNFRMSPPSKWLRISTTLFQQSVSAYRQGVLQLKTLKDGFECPSPLPPPHSLCRILINNRFHATIPRTMSPRSDPLPNNPVKNLPSRDNPTLPRDPVLPPGIPLPRSPRRRSLLLHPRTPQNLPSFTNPGALYS